MAIQNQNATAPECKCADEVCQEELDALLYRSKRRSGIAPTTEGEKDAEKRELKESLFGICLSGGGIRSATFNLGILQGLAKTGLLELADYLSTVSGGGYIGAWLHGVIKRRADFQQFLANEDTKPGDASEDPVTFLRKYSNYLAPQLGILSPDTWVIAAIWFRNTLLNQLVLFLVLLSVLLVPFVVTNAVGLFANVLARSAAASWSLGTAAFSFLLIAVVRVCMNLAEVVKAPEDRHIIRIPKNSAHFFRKSADPEGDSAPDNSRSVWWFVLLPMWLSAAALSALCAGRSLPLTSILTGTAAFCSLLCLFAVLVFGGGFQTCYDKRHEHKRNDVIGAAAGFAITLISSAATFCMVEALWWVMQHYAWSAAWCIGLGPILHLGALVLGAILAIGLMGLDFPDAAREWTAAISARNLILTCAWAGLFLASAWAPWRIVHWFQGGYWHTAYAAALAWLGSTAAGVLSGRSALTTGQASKNDPRKSKSSGLELVAVIAPPIAMAGLLIAVGTCGYLIVGTLSPDPYSLRGLQTVWVLLIAVGAAGVATALSTRFNINEFSMNHFYKNRLVRCYLGASRGADRKANRITGFDPEDDFPITELDPRRGYQGPFAIVNCALNLNHGAELAWQERKASSFIFTPLFSGYSPARRGRPGYVTTSNFTEKAGPRLGTAIATSGAAVNPNWGYHTNPATAFLLTLFNVRLGWWVGNTQQPAQAKRPGPRVAIWSLLSELLGWTDEKSKFVNLSDGGHFENLGLYELLRRRCRYIIVGDGEQDPDYVFESLGGAIRKARIDFGIDIKIAPKRIVMKQDFSEVHCAFGTIHYPAGPSGPAATGLLLYLKASVTGDEPYDVTQYRSANGEFPHQSTTNQFFTESQFESYRQLGKHIVEKVFQRTKQPAADYGDLKAMFSVLQKSWLPATVAAPGVFSRHAEAYSSLLRELANDPDLRFLDSEIVDGTTPMRTPRPSTSQINKGHLFCLRCIQLMENVYVDLGLEDDEELNHQLNEGWKDVFLKWKSGKLFSETWLHNQQAFGYAFRSFYDRLGSDKPAPKVERPLAHEARSVGDAKG